MTKNTRWVLTQIARRCCLTPAPKSHANDTNTLNNNRQPSVDAQGPRIVTAQVDPMTRTSVEPQALVLAKDRRPFAACDFLTRYDSWCTMISPASLNAVCVRRRLPKFKQALEKRAGDHGNNGNGASGWPRVHPTSDESRHEVGASQIQTSR